MEQFFEQYLFKNTSDKEQNYTILLVAEFLTYPTWVALMAKEGKDRDWGLGTKHRTLER